MKANLKRATIYLDSDLREVLRIKAAASGCSVSELVNEALRAKFAEDLAALERRAQESKLRFEDVLEELRQRAEI